MIALADASAVGAPTIEGLPQVVSPSFAEELPAIQENGDPLVPIPPEVRQLPVYWQENWRGARRELFVRAGVGERLVSAAAALPVGFELVVLDAWRTLELQVALFDHYYGRPGLVPGYVSRPDDDRVPPHFTGGAVDVTLSWEGHPLALGTQFDSLDERAWPHALEATGEEPDRSLRRLLTQVMGDQGFVVYPFEWWHFSYGDQLWASAHRVDHALYGRAAPAPSEG
jgi:D-alanyl-D-alanine dipeptidase